MWLSRILFLSLVLPVTACGFSPLYQKTGTTHSVGRAFSSIQVAAIPNRAGQQLRNLLVADLNPVGEPREPAYILKIILSESSANLGIKRDTTATFSRLTVNVIYHLEAAETHKVLFKSSAKSTNSFNVVDSPYATQVAENDARERALREIGQAIKLRLGAFLTDR